MSELYNAKLNGDELHVLHSSGFFSCCSVTLYDLLKMNNPVKVVWPYDKWMGPDGKAYSHYFNTTLEFNELPDGKMHHPAVGPINGYNFEQLSKMVPLYFSPRPRIQNIVDRLVDKYEIDFSDTVYLKIRGTDKITENPRIHSDVYLDEIEKCEANCVLVQTDEKGILNHVKRKITGKRVIYFDEIGFDTDEKPSVPHHFASNYLATTIVASKCAEVVCDAGNHGFWICMYRGSRDKVTQLYSYVSVIK
jgi:hypothetical protein